LVVPAVINVGDATPLAVAVTAWGGALECTPFGKCGDSASTIDSSPSWFLDNLA
jgi:hypothetical protein